MLEPVESPPRFDRSLADWIARLFRCEALTQIGHAQRPEDLNLGLGFLYYSLARLVRHPRAVVIGSLRGFVPLVLARALAENSEGGEVVFIDPSFVDDFWKDPNRVRAHFESFGIDNVRHYPFTTQEFAETEVYRELDEVGLVFVDGYHTEVQAEYDFRTFEPKLASNGFFLFHDSVRCRLSRIYGPGKHYEHTVQRFIDRLKKDSEWQLMDYPIGDGVTIARRIE